MSTPLTHLFSSFSSSTNRNGIQNTTGPNIIRPKKQLVNSVSLVSSVNSPLKSLTSYNGLLFAYTYLKVTSPSNSNRFISLL